METVSQPKYKRVKGLVRTAGWIFIVWGAVVAAKGFLDAFFLTPESEFVPMTQWIQKWAPFEVVYGCVCIVVGFLCFKYAERMR